MFSRFRFFLILIGLLMCLCSSEQVGVLQTRLPLSQCGDMYAPPFAQASDAGPRKCGLPVLRSYRPQHKGLGFEILDSESKACFVPDQEYRLLDEVIDAVMKQLSMIRC